MLEWLTDLLVLHIWTPFPGSSYQRQQVEQHLKESHDSHMILS